MGRGLIETLFIAAEKYFNQLAPAVNFCSLRLMSERRVLSVRRDVVQPVRRREDRGAMIVVHRDGSLGYGAMNLPWSPKIRFYTMPPRSIPANAPTRIVCLRARTWWSRFWR